MNLPLSHPEYRYPRSRNPYGEGLKRIAETGARPNAYADNEAERFQGAWRQRFPIDAFAKIRRAPGVPGGEVVAMPLADAAEAGAPATPARPELHVEIGCNAGHVTIEWAARDPRASYIGLDWKHKAVFRAAEKAAKRGLRNAIFVRGNAERLGFLFGPGEIDRLSIFFPDPWPKTSHWKNRTLTEARLRDFAGVVRPGGVLHIKTDHAGYFDWIEKAAGKAADSWRVLERSRDLHLGHPDPSRLEIPEVTLFEKLFIRDGIPINSLKLERV